MTYKTLIVLDKDDNILEKYTETENYTFFPHITESGALMIFQVSMDVIHAFKVNEHLNTFKEAWSSWVWKNVYWVKL